MTTERWPIEQFERGLITDKELLEDPRLELDPQYSPAWRADFDRRMTEAEARWVESQWKCQRCGNQDRREGRTETLCWYCAKYPEPAYEAHLRELDADDRRAEERRGKDRLHEWGDLLPGGYFCAPCWDRGDPTGLHPYDVPPCDRVVRRGAHY